MRYLPLLLLLIGCVQAPASLAKPVKKPVPIIQPSKVETSVLKVETDLSLLKGLQTYLGTHNTLTLSEPLKIAKDGTTISLPANTSLNWTFSDAKNVVIFKEPKPVITVKEWGVTLHPVLDQVELLSSEKGQATVTELGKQFKRDFSLVWHSSTGNSISESVLPHLEPLKPEPDLTPIPLSEGLKREIGAASDEKPKKPSLYYFGDKETCPPCKKAMKELDEYQKAGKELPFELVKNSTEKKQPKDSGTPCWMWTDSKGEWVYIDGWKNVEHLIKEFNKSVGVKKASATVRTRTTGRCQIGFGGSWVENKLGYTSVHHLVYDHHIPYDSLRPYVNDQNALNWIHGWAHTRVSNVRVH